MMAKQQMGGLGGKGLSALIPQKKSSAPAGAPENAIVEIEAVKIRPNPKQPRRKFDPEALQELAASIAGDGLIEPVVVRKTADGAYELIAGERRLRAMRDILKRQMIPVVIRTAADIKMRTLALVENIHRQDLGPIEEARAFRELIDELGVTHQQASEQLHVSRSTITNSMRLLELPEQVLDLVESGKLAAGSARALLPLSDVDAQIRLANRCVAEDLSTRKIEEIVSGQKIQPEIVSGKKIFRRSGDIERLENRLTEYFGVRTQIVDKAGKGRIILEYTSPDESRQILERMGLPAE